MKVYVKDDRLFISLKLQKPTLSKSGKTRLVASTHGVRQSRVEISGKRVRYIAHAFIDNEK